MWVRIVHPTTGRFIMEVDFTTWTVRHKERGEVIDTPLLEHRQQWLAAIGGTAVGGTATP